jgi:hypothetical protein
MLPMISDDTRFHAYEYARHANELSRLMRNVPVNLVAAEREEGCMRREAHTITCLVLQDMGVGLEAGKGGLVTWDLPEGVPEP